MAPGFSQHLENYYDKAASADKARCLELLTSLKIRETADRGPIAKETAGRGSVVTEKPTRGTVTWDTPHKETELRKRPHTAMADLSECFQLTQIFYFCFSTLFLGN